MLLTEFSTHYMAILKFQALESNFRGSVFYRNKTPQSYFYLTVFSSRTIHCFHSLKAQKADFSFRLKFVIQNALFARKTQPIFVQQSNEADSLYLHTKCAKVAVSVTQSKSEILYKHSKKNIENNSDYYYITCD